MANPGYVRSTDGSNADNGSTWALANLDLAGATADQAAGDRVWVSDNHAESTAAAVTLNWAGTTASPVYVLCGDDSAEPPTALATTGTVTTTGNNSLTLSSASDAVYYYGLTFNAATGAVSVNCSTGAGDLVVLQNCVMSHVGTGANGRVVLAASDSRLIDTQMKFGATGQGVSVTGERTSISGGAIASGSSAITGFIKAMNAARSADIEGFDFTNAASSINLCESTTAGITVRARNCKLPASWSGAPHSGTPGIGSRIEMFNCDNADTNYRLRVATFAGTIQDETTLVRTGGASDGTTTISWKLVTNANAEHPMIALDSPEIVRWNDTTGSAITVTVHGLLDSATNIKDNEVWLEVQYLGTSGVPLSLFTTDGVSVIATGADQASSTETWTTTGMTNPNKFKLAVTFTPQEKGFVHAVVKLAKASTTVYIDPMLNVS